MKRLLRGGNAQAFFNPGKAGAVGFKLCVDRFEFGPDFVPKLFEFGPEFIPKLFEFGPDFIPELPKFTPKVLAKLLDVFVRIVDAFVCIVDAFIDVAEALVLYPTGHKDGRADGYGDLHKGGVQERGIHIVFSVMNQRRGKALFQPRNALAMGFEVGANALQPVLDLKEMGEEGARHHQKQATQESSEGADDGTYGLKCGGVHMHGYLNYRRGKHGPASKADHPATPC
jgi:hypothetical protein